LQALTHTPTVLTANSCFRKLQLTVQLLQLQLLRFGKISCIWSASLQ
jgi:hypothetical protein